MRLLRDRKYSAFLLQAIEKARKRIEARIFLIDPGSGGKHPVRRIFKSLQKAQKRGIHVRILTDGIFQTKPSGRRLKTAGNKFGLSIEWDAKSAVLHEKTVSVDDRIYIVGSHNWTEPSLLENHELSIQLTTEEARREGNKLDALAFSKQIIQDIDQAQKEILIASYELDESPGPDDFGTEITEALIRAKRRGLRVTLLLDASQLRVPETGEIFYHYRGLRKVEELARAGVLVYYDTTTTLFHAKTAIIDNRFTYIGSQNLEIRKDVAAREATIRVDSSKISKQAKEYLTGILRESSPFRDERSKVKGLPLPVSFLEKNGVLSRMYTHQSEETFRFYISLLKAAWQKGSNQVKRAWPRSLQDDRRRLVRRYRLLAHEPGAGTKRAKVTLIDPETEKPFIFPDKDFFVVPDSFFDLGWFERLQHLEIFVFWIHLAKSQHSAQSPFWSMRQTDLIRQFGISRWTLSTATIALERWNLIEVIRDPNITLKNVVKKPNRYRMNRIGSPEEFALAKKKVLEELSMSVKSLKEAEELASWLNQPNDLEVIRKFLLLIERYGPEKTKRAARITARFKPHFALRSVHHTAGILRNWSQGIQK